MSSTPKYGKLAKAPCGHEGEHVLGNYVRCASGCDEDAIPLALPLEKTLKICSHYSRYLMDGKTWCVACGRKL